MTLLMGPANTPKRWRDTSEACYCRVYYCGPDVEPRKPLLWHADSTLTADIATRHIPSSVKGLCVSYHLLGATSQGACLVQRHIIHRSLPRCTLLATPKGPGPSPKHSCFANQTNLLQCRCNQQAWGEYRQKILSAICYSQGGRRGAGRVYQ